MAIEVRCECGKVLNVADKHAGKTGKCPACGRMLHIVASGPQPGAGGGVPPGPIPPPGMGGSPPVSEPPAQGFPPMPGQPSGSSLPWQDRAQHGFFGALFKTIGAVLFKPGQAFSSIRIVGTLGSSLLFVLIAGSVGQLIATGWSQVISSAGMPGMAGLPVDPEMLAFQGMLSGVMLILVPVFVVIGSFFGAGITHLCLMMVGGAKETFEATYAVVAYAQGSTAMLNVIPICGALVGGIWYIVATIIGLAQAHKIGTGRAAAAVLLPIVVCCLGVVALFVGAGFMAAAAEGM